MKLDKAEAQLQGRLEHGERVLVSTVGAPLVNSASLSAADLVGSGGGAAQRAGLGIGGAIVRRNDKMIRRDAVTGGEGSIARSVPTEAKAFGLVLTDRRLALYHRNVELDLQDAAWEIPRERVVGVRKLARTTLMRRLRVHFDDGSTVDISMPPGKSMGVMREELGTAP
jgi:hypothetical protein